jgi:type I restriction enzyme S subunit
MTFREVQLQDVLDVQWGDTKTTKGSYVPSGYVAYSASGPDGFLEKFDFEQDGIVLSAIGANCGATFYAEGKWSCIKNTIRILNRSESIDLKYVYYMTKSPYFWPIRGSAQPFISQTDIRELYVRVPELSVQKFIGNMLYQLEQKIAANLAASTTLQEMAQAIFKSWFIDFEPVKAKMANQEPVGMNEETAGLFPDSMEESELGLIPSGWQIKQLGEVVDVGWGDAKTTKASYLPSGYKAYSAKGQDGLLSKFDYSEMGVVLSAIGANCGKTWLATGNWSCIKNTIRIICVANYPTAIPYVFQLSKEPNFWEKRGTAQPFIAQRDSRSLRIRVPPTELLDAYSQIATPILSLANQLQDASQALEEIRDSLLPRLISGELQISEEMLAP